jgi:hypothetical protein
MQDKAADLADPIKKFRQSITNTVLPASFQDLDDFSAGLRKTIQDRLGTAERVPPLLPYYCDRSEQYQRIDELLWERRKNTDSRVLIVLVQADEFQCGSQFIDVLRAKIPRFPATRDLGEPVSYELEWPKSFDSPEDFRLRLRRDLADRVTGNRHASRGEIEQAIKAISGPILVHTYLLTSEWQRTGKDAVLEFYRFWDEWTQLARTHPFIVILRVEYEVVQTSLGRFWPSRIERANRELRAFLRDCFTPENAIFDILRELPRIARDDAERWSRMDEVRRFVPDADLEPHVRELYRSKFAKEPEGQPCMEPLAKELGQLLRTRP